MSDDQMEAAPADGATPLATALIVLTTIMLLTAMITTLKQLGDQYREGVLASK